MFLVMIILAGALLTILIEAAVFMFSAEYRNRRFMLTVAVVNLTSNLLLNFGFWLSGQELELLSLPVLLAEFLVFICEFVAYGMIFRFRWKLLIFTFLANAITFACSFFFD